MSSPSETLTQVDVSSCAVSVKDTSALVWTRGLKLRPVHGKIRWWRQDRERKHPSDAEVETDLSEGMI